MALSSDRLEKLKQQKAAIDAKLQREHNRLRRQERKNDTRRKILVGALVLKAMETDTHLEKTMTRLLESLKRDDERALFGLAPLKLDQKTSSSRPHE